MEDESYKTIFPNNKSIDTKSDYHYDSLYRLIEATGKEHPALSGKEEIITPIPHLNNQNAISNYTEYYDFDYGSNITKIRHNGKNSSTQEFYISNKSNRSLPIIDRRSVNESNIDESYDERGNVLKLNGSQNLRWNYRDNISYVDIITRPSGKNDSEYYVYDSGGQRVRKVTEAYQNNEKNSSRVEKIYFGDIEVTRTYQNNSLSKEKYTVHVMDDKSRVALHHYWTRGTSDETRNSQSRYQLSNHLDSVALELNDNAEIITYEEYLPFGETALIAGKTVREVTEKEYRYSGKERDDNTGLYYYGARYYAPWLLRWVNPDPAGTVDGLNLYQFVKGNPVNMVDLFGLTAPNSTRTRTSSFDSSEISHDISDTESDTKQDKRNFDLEKGESVSLNTPEYHALSRHRDFFYTLAEEDATAKAAGFPRDLLEKPSTKLNPPYQDKSSGYGHAVHSSHTTALTIKREYRDNRALKSILNPLEIRLGHTQNQPGKENTGRFGKSMDKFNKSSDSLSKGRRIDFSKDTFTKEEIDIAIELSEDFLKALPDTEKELVLKRKPSLSSQNQKRRHYMEQILKKSHEKYKIVFRALKSANDNQASSSSTSRKRARGS